MSNGMRVFVLICFVLATLIFIAEKEGDLFGSFDLSLGGGESGDSESAGGGGSAGRRAPATGDLFAALKGTRGRIIDIGEEAKGLRLERTPSGIALVGSKYTVRVTEPEGYTIHPAAMVVNGQFAAIAAVARGFGPDRRRRCRAVLRCADQHGPGQLCRS